MGGRSVHELGNIAPPPDCAQFLSYQLSSLPRSSRC
jgi:hypothetical protein